jgi:NADH/NAD ratio-sensing transcriptional regulator Rex
VLTSCHQQGSSNAAATEEEDPLKEAVATYCNHYNTNTSITNLFDTHPAREGQEEETDDMDTDEDAEMQGIEQETGSFTGVLAEALRNANLSTASDQSQCEDGKG